MAYKVYYNGKRVYTFWDKVKNFIVKMLYILALVCFVGAVLLIFRQIYPKIEYRSETKEVLVDNLSVKVNQLKGALIDDLKQCESQGFNEDFGLITFDGHKTNKKVEIPSIGSYQFKKATVIYYYDLLYGKDITGKEAVLIALDDEKSAQLASDIIFKTDKGLTNWVNCSKKVNATSRLATINELLK